MIDMETEEQIYDLLIKKDKTAVLIWIYTPGHFVIEKIDKMLMIESGKYFKKYE